SPTVTGPVFWQAIDEFDGSTNQFPLESLSIRPRLNRLIWQLTPCTFGSATASTTIVLPVQSFLKRPTSSAEAREITARRARQLIIGRCIGNIYQLHGDYCPPGGFAANRFHAHANRRCLAATSGRWRSHSRSR